MIPLAAVLSHWYVWAILAGGFALVGASFIKKTSHRVEIGVPGEQKARTVEMQTAEDYAGQLKEMNEEAGAAKEDEGKNNPGQELKPGSTITPTEGSLGKVFSRALSEKVKSVVMESEVNFSVDAPILVEGGELKVDIHDGEIGRIVMKTKKQEVPAT